VNPICIKPVDRDNWEEAVSISLFETQVKMVPSVIESLAYAYIKPWDEALDPYILHLQGKVIGFFYISYTPESTDNYWIGGFQIDKDYQGKGIGEVSLERIIEFIKEKHSLCKVISLTIERNNERARKLYERIGFINQDIENQSGEIIFRLEI
jgi:diamine N-acetyltransferase